MRVSVVTPSFNQGKYLEETIRSVLDQNYGDIEYIVIDGGSRDESLEIIKKYEQRISYWQTGKDRNAWDAINQGWERATGEILCYLNADDVFLPGSIELIANQFKKSPDVDVVYGDTEMIDAQGNHLYDSPSEPFDLAKIYRTWVDPIRQPSCFFKSNLFRQYGGTNEIYPFCADFEYWIRISAGAKFLYVPVLLSKSRLHSETRTSKMEYVQARELIHLAKQAVSTDEFRKTGVSREETLGGAYYRAMMHFRNAGHKQEALQSYFHYCRYSLSVPEGIYRMARFCVSLLIR